MHAKIYSAGFTAVLLATAFGVAFVAGRGFGATEDAPPSATQTRKPVPSNVLAAERAADIQLPSELAAQVPAFAQPHVLAVGRYFHTAVRSQLAQCLADVKPHGVVEVRHHFVVEERDASPSLVAVHAFEDTGEPSFEITASDVGDHVLPHVQRCLGEAAGRAEFPHVAVHPGAPRDPFVTFQVYEFQSHQPKD